MEASFTVTFLMMLKRISVFALDRLSSRRQRRRLLASRRLLALVRLLAAAATACFLPPLRSLALSIGGSVRLVLGARVMRGGGVRRCAVRGLVPHWCAAPAGFPGCGAVLGSSLRCCAGFAARFGCCGLFV